MNDTSDKKRSGRYGNINNETKVYKSSSHSRRRSRSHSRSRSPRSRRRSHSPHSRRRSRSRSPKKRNSQRKRSGSRDRDRERDRERSDRSERYVENHFIAVEDEFGHNNYDREKDREKSYFQRDRREEIPNNTIMIRGLASHICENDIVVKLAEHNLQAKDIRLMRKKETGASRGFAFVEFSNINHAIQWKELTEGVVDFSEECQATVHYSIPKDSFGVDKNIMKNDWCCYKCGVNNFKRRDECFKCGTPKEESVANDTGEEVSLTPTNALLLRNLAPLTTEERILTILGSITALPIKSIRILKDITYGVSRGMCLVELHTTLEASQLFTLLSSMSPGFIIDDFPVSINYGKRNNATAAQISSNAANAAIVALAAAQWTNQKDDSDSTNQYDNCYDNNKYSGNTSHKKSGSVNINGVEYRKYEPPIVSSFQFDESSGYYYDSTTGFYYDSNTHYYYNPQNQQYIYWDSVNKTYLPVESTTTQPVEEEKKEKSKDAKQDKVKIAKKIAKDMEKWAKTLNQKKESARSWIPANETSVSLEANQSTYSAKSSTADAGYLLLEQHISQDDSELFTIDSNNLDLRTNINFDDNKFHSSVLLNPYEIIKAEERRLTDWDKLACLLCKRQFSTPELLTKHQQLSDLHKSNMMILKRSKLSEEQIEELEKSENDAGYRDRAKERRKKYGIPETPEISKLKSKYLSELEERSSTETSTQATNVPISDDNIGNKMLKAMGWTEGMGLGRSNQGMSNIIEVEMRVGSVGLGMRANTSSNSNETYKDAVRRTMHQRFKEISDRE